MIWTSFQSDYNQNMKKLALFLISLMLSFNSYGKWTEIPILEDDSIEQGFIDFDNLKRKNDDYVYWWMMTSRSDSSEKIYLRTDCEGERMNSAKENQLQFNQVKDGLIPHQTQQCIAF